MRFEKVILFVILVLPVVFFSCASKTIDTFSYPDLYIINADQKPNPLGIGKKGTLIITVGNRGGTSSQMTSFRLWNEENRVFAEQPVSPLSPDIRLDITFSLPPADKSYTLIAVVNPDKNIYEPQRMNNRMVIGIGVVSADELKKRDSIHEKKFLEADKKISFEQCKSKIVLRNFQRPGVIMDYEKARAGEKVRFSVELENKCEKGLKDIILKWVLRKTDDLSDNETVFGVVPIQLLGPGEKIILRRTMTARSGHWKAGLKLVAGLKGEEISINLKPEFFLNVEQDE